MLLFVGVSVEGGVGFVLLLGDEMPLELLLWVGGSATADGLLCLHPMIIRCR